MSVSWIVARYMIPVLQECELFWCWTRTLVPRCCSPATRAETPASCCRHDAAASSRSTTASSCQGWEATTVQAGSGCDAFSLVFGRCPVRNSTGSLTILTEVFLWFSWISPQKCLDSSLKLATTAYFDIIYNSSLIILFFDILYFWKQLSLLPPSSSLVANVVVWLLMHRLPPKLEVCGMSMILLLLSIRAVMFCLE